MKLKTRITLMVSVPLIFLGVVIYFVGYNRITTVMSQEVKTSLASTALSVRETLSTATTGDYQLIEDEMWKGDTLNISQSFALADNITEKTGTAITVFYGDTRYMTSVKDDSGARVLGTKASDQVVAEVLQKGNEYFGTNVDVVGERYFAYYVPLYGADGTTPVGMVFAGKSQEAVESEIYAILNIILAVLVVITVLAIILAILEAGHVVSGIKYSIKILDRVAEGDLAVGINSKKLQQKDEVGNILQAIAKTKSTLSDTVREIMNNSNKLHNASTELSEDSEATASTVEQVEEAVNEIAMGATSQAQETQRATEHVITMGHMVEDTNTEVVNLQQNSLSIKSAGSDASDKLNELGAINAQAHSAIEEIYAQTHTTNDSAKKIQEAVEVITSIAEETNLLSLNASIEAARAGEQGRGFAVVAAQIQKLAEQSNHSAMEVSDIVTALLQDSQDAVRTMDEVQTIMEKQNQTVEETSSIVTGVIQGIDASVESITAIAERTKNLDTARVQVVDVVQNLTAIAEENAASTEETSASTSKVSEYVSQISDSAKSLNEVADQLKQCINQFIIEDSNI